MVNVRTLVRRLFGADTQALDEQQTDDDGAGRSAIGQLKREFADHPSKGLTPAKLYEILEAAEQGDIKAQHELFDDMEEKDAQIGADLGKRRQLTAEREWQIVPPDNATAQERKAADHAAEVFSALEVEDLILDLGAGIGHGWSNLSLPWSRDGAMRYIEQPEFCPHSWFRLHPDNQNILTLRDASAQGAELWPFGWVQHRHRAKGGYVARMGLHRMLVWPYLFQNYALGDLAQLLEIYGLPARVGKFPKNATDKEKATLLRAVVSMGKDAAGIIPEGMSIEFMEAAGKGASADMYKMMMDWCERSKAKAILGGTLTSGTGEGTNTNALGNVHERGQMSLIRSDARQYAGTIRRDILWPMAAMNFGIDQPQRAPRFYLDTSETENLKDLAETLPAFVDMGAKIPLWWFYEKSGIPKAGDDEDYLMNTPTPASISAARQAGAKVAALAARPAQEAPDVVSQYVDQLQDVTNQVSTDLIDQIRSLVDSANSLEEIRETLLTLDLSPEELASSMSEALQAAALAGRYELLEEAQ